MIERRDDFDEGSRVVRDVYGAAESATQGSAAPRVINVATVNVLERARSFAYRNKGTFRVVRVPWHYGIALEHLDSEIRARIRSDRMGERQTLLELEALFTDAVNIMWALTEPRGIVDRWRRWRQKGNPFADVNVAEFTALITFFYECQMRLSDLALGGMPDSLNTRPSRFRSILPTAWRNSLSASQPGSRATDIPSATSIFDSDSAGSKLTIPERR